MSGVFHIDQRTGTTISHQIAKNNIHYKSTHTIVKKAFFTACAMQVYKIRVKKQELNFVPKTTDIQMVKVPSKEHLPQADFVGLNYSINIYISKSDAAMIATDWICTEKYSKIKSEQTSS